MMLDAQHNQNDRVFHMVIGSITWKNESNFSKTTKLMNHQTNPLIN